MHICDSVVCSEGGGRSAYIHAGLHIFLPKLFRIILSKRFQDRLCGLVVRVFGYRYRGPGFDPRRYQIF